MKKIITSFSLILLASLVLAGCSWPFGKDEVVNSTNEVDTTETTNIEVSTKEEAPTKAASTNLGNMLSKPEHGFSISYPEDYTVDENISCFEGCPEGAAVPLFDLTGPQSHIAVEVYGSELRAVEYQGNFSSVADYMASGIPTNVSSSLVTGGMRYDFKLPGYSSNGPSIMPNVPDQIVVFFVGVDGKTFGLSTAQNAGAEQDLLEIADSFSFL